MEILIYLIIGACAGFTAGLFGVGGGLIIVPLLYAVFLQQGYAPQYIMHMALGTSLATIIVTSISSVSAHHKKGAVLWQVVKNLAPGLVVGAFLGAAIADVLPSHILQFIIGLFALWVATKMLFARAIQVDTQRQLPSNMSQAVAGGGIGIASAIFGIGGGSLTVPYLNKHGIIMQQAVATSAACGFPIAIAGAVGFVVFGATLAAPIPGAIGYVHIYAFLGISSMSFVMAKLGAQLAHQLSAQRLKQCFAVLLICVGLFFLVKSMQWYLS